MSDSEINDLIAKHTGWAHNPDTGLWFFPGLLHPSTERPNFVEFMGREMCLDYLKNKKLIPHET